MSVLKLAFHNFKKWFLRPKTKLKKNYFFGKFQIFWKKNFFFFSTDIHGALEKGRKCINCAWKDYQKHLAVNILNVSLTLQYDYQKKTKKLLLQNKKRFSSKKKMPFLNEIVAYCGFLLDIPINLFKNII
jgi:hypothetical protein